MLELDTKIELSLERRKRCYTTFISTDRLFAYACSAVALLNYVSNVGAARESHDDKHGYDLSHHLVNIWYDDAPTYHVAFKI